MNNEKRDALAAKLMDLLLKEGLASNISKGSLEESSVVMQEHVEALTIVSARIITSYLMKQISEGVDSAQVDDTAQTILVLASDHLNRCLDHSLMGMISQLDEMLDDVKGNKQTSH